MNKYYNINKFPKDWGLIVFPISMSRIAHGQTPETYYDYLTLFLDKLIDTKTGVHFQYTDVLYMNYEKNALNPKKFAQDSISHMNAMKNIQKRHNIEFQIESAFSFSAWFQMYLSHTDFFSALSKIKKLYENDAQFQVYMKNDALEAGLELSEQQINFYLEEHLYSYLLINQQLIIDNRYTDHREQWILLAYPGATEAALIYLIQIDPFGLNKNTSNPYIGHYDLSKHIFIDFLKTDLETYNPSEL